MTFIARFAIYTAVGVASFSAGLTVNAVTDHDQQKSQAESVRGPAPNSASVSALREAPR